MDWALFSAAFILQFVGHRIGDYILQTHRQSQNKTKDKKSLFDHCITYSLMIATMLLFVVPFKWVVVTFLITFIEHMIIDTRKPVIWLKTFLEKFNGNKYFDINDIPLFVVMEIDQTIHLIRIFLISLLIAYFN